MIDWLNVTMEETTFYWGERGVPVTDDQLIVEISAMCETIFGFGITSKRDKGANFYHRSWVLGDDCGMVCYGGQRDTVLISLSGEGCAASMPGWEKRLYEFLLGRGKRVRLTRLDLAHDDYEGKRYSVDKAVEDYDAGRFNCGGRPPNIEQRGNWKRPSGKGRTVYIGNRQNGKFLRVYEKGRQLGDKESEWVRIEGEFKSASMDLPLEMLIMPGAYLAAMYPALSFLQQDQRRLKTKRKEVQFSYAKTLEWLRHQCGAALWFCAEIEGGAAALLEKVQREWEFPRGLKGSKDWREARTPIHRVARLEISPGHELQWA